MTKTLISGLIGIVAASAIVLSGTAAANAADFPVPTTDTAGTLSIATHQYSNSTIDVVADYSSILHSDTEIQVTARDAATGAVVSTETMDNAICLSERVMGGFDYKHNYIFDAKLVWKDGSQPAISAPAVRQNMSYTNTVYWMKYTPLNQDVPESSLGFHDCVSISEGSYTLADTSTTHTAQPTTSAPAAVAVKAAKLKSVKAAKSSVAVKWSKGVNVKQYKIALQKINGKKSTKTFKLTASHSSYTIKKLARHSFYMLTLTTLLKDGSMRTTSTAVYTK